MDFLTAKPGWKQWKCLSLQIDRNKTNCDNMRNLKYKTTTNYTNKKGYIGENALEIKSRKTEISY
jgi:hypothetical protein